MTDYEKHANERLGFIQGLVSRGVDPELAEFCAKQAEYETIGMLSPSEYIDGFSEKLAQMSDIEKTAKSSRITIITGDDDDEDDLAPAPVETESKVTADKSDESIWDKIKRWGLLAGVGAGVGAGGFALGNYWPEIRNYGKQSFDGIKKYYRDLASN